MDWDQDKVIDRESKQHTGPVDQTEVTDILTWTGIRTKSSTEKASNTLDWWIKEVIGLHIEEQDESMNRDEALINFLISMSL